MKQTSDMNAKIYINAVGEKMYICPKCGVAVDRENLPSHKHHCNPETQKWIKEIFK